MTHLICTMVLLLPGGYRDVVRLNGLWVKETSDYYYVDFTEEFKKRGITNIPMVQKVKDNACLFTDAP